MKSWQVFLITLGTLYIIIFPKDNKPINLIIGIFLIFIGIILFYKRNRK